MCVLPGRLRFNDDASERAAGTAPPAHGEIVQSGAGSGQYALRSTCASAAPGSASTRATVATRVLMRREPTGACAARRRSGDLVQRAVAALGRRQPATLRRDRPTLHAVGVVDDHVDVAGLRRVLRDLVDPGGTHPTPRLRDLARDVLLDADVVGRVVARGVAGDEDRRELVERVLAVGLRILLVGVADEDRLVVVAVPGPAARGQLALGGDREVHQRAAPDEPALERLARVAHLVELLADRGLLDRLLVGRQIGAAGLQRGVDLLAGEDARLDAVVDALERDGVDHAGAVA